MVPGPPDFAFLRGHKPVVSPPGAPRAAGTHSYSFKANFEDVVKAAASELAQKGYRHASAGIHQDKMASFLLEDVQYRRGRIIPSVTIHKDVQYVVDSEGYMKAGLDSKGWVAIEVDEGNDEDGFLATIRRWLGM
jgi:hypothetical protein